MATAQKSILVVDDDETLLKVFTRVLERAGYRVVNSLGGEQALARLRDDAIDGIVTDLVMPGMSGLEFVQQVRVTDPEMPIVVVTGTPGFDTAVRAIDFGVFRYVTKPVKNHELVRAVSDAVHARALAKARKAAFGQMVRPSEVEHDASALERALQGAWLAMQPIVSETQRSVVAYEALLRSHDSILRDPMAILLAAERLGQLQRVGHTVRNLAARLMLDLRADALLFLNLHPLDLLDESLFAASAPLCAHAPRIVLEITERASLEHVPDVRARIAALKQLGFRIALDDMGAGYAGLTSFAMLEPHFVKIDMSLVRDVDGDTVKQTLIRTLVGLAHELGIEVIAEGVETPAEMRCLTDLGLDLLQGYLFARPGPPFPVAFFPPSSGPSENPTVVLL